MDAKAIRKQIKNVLQEQSAELLTATVGAAIQKALGEQLTRRLDSVNQYCVDQLTKQDKRARDVQGFLMREVRMNIRNSLADMDVTIEAVVKVLAESGVVVEGFIEKVNATKPIIVKEREEEAKANMEAELKAQQEAVSAPVEQPSQEAPIAPPADQL